MKKINEKLKNNNFTKLTRTGISLIVLVITIIVIIILAAAIIISLNNNNPIMESNKARYESDCVNMQALFTSAVAKVMAKNQATLTVSPGQINTVTGGVSQTTGEVAYTLKDAQNMQNSTGKIVFDKKDNTDIIFYTGKQLPIYAAGNTIWHVDEEGEISVEVAGTKYGSGKISKVVNAKTVSEQANIYYGANVNYKTGNVDIDNEVNWEILYSDNNNIYLIATDYIHSDFMPEKTLKLDDGRVIKYTPKDESFVYFADFFSIRNSEAYKGSEDITDERLQSLNEKYYKYLKDNNITIENGAMKAIAYMLDIHIWNKFVGENADYAIGGPTIEMIINSYNQKYNTNYKTQVTSVNGYQVSSNEGNNWEDECFFEINEKPYASLTGDERACATWLASPSNKETYVTYLSEFGNIGCNFMFAGGGGFGLRPVVCLNSNVSLKEVESGYEINLSK